LDHAVDRAPGDVQPVGKITDGKQPGKGMARSTIVVRIVSHDSLQKDASRMPLRLQERGRDDAKIELQNVENKARRGNGS
jgi:hypothetical protein